MPASYSGLGLAVLAQQGLAASPKAKGCCAGCEDGSAPCADPLVAGALDDLKTAKWFLDNRWTIMGTAFAAGGVFFATVAYFVNRKP